MLANQLRFNDEIKKYGGYVYNVKHAAKLRAAADEQDLANVEIDEAVFENAKPCDQVLRVRGRGRGVMGERERVDVWAVSVI